MTATQDAPPTAGRAETSPRRALHDPFWQWTAAAVVLALIVRFAWVAYAGHNKPLGLYDPARYVGYAERIAQGKGYVEGFTGQPTSYYPPGYPWFLGIIAWLQAHLPLGSFLTLAAGLVQAVLGAATAGFAAMIGRRLVSWRAGVIAAFGVALYPNLVFHTAAMLSETLYNFLFLGFLAVLVARSWPAGLSTRRVAVAAVFFGAAVLVRPISLAVIPVLSIVWWLSTRSFSSALRFTGATVGVVLAMILPWTIRNEVRMHAFIPLSTNTGDNLCIGHHPGANGGFDLTMACDSGEGVQFGTRSEVRSDHIKTSRGLSYLTHHLSDEPRLILRRGYYMFKRDDDALLAVRSYGTDRWMSDSEVLWLSRLANSVYAVVAVVGVVGLIRLTLSRRPEALLLVLSTIATIAVPLAFFGDSRFKVPAMPLLIIAAAAAISRFEPSPSELRL